MQNNLNEAKRYLISYLLIVLIGLSLLFFISIYIQPLDGDLTRMGGYAEKDFGWNIPQEVLNSNIYLNKSYDKYYDIVVLGDSFSKHGLWQSYFTENYNLTFTTLTWDSYTVEDILNNPVFYTNPPKIFIIESVVRLLPLRFSFHQECSVVNKPIYHDKWRLQQSEKKNLFVSKIRDTSFYWSKINLKFALTYLENSFLRIFFKTDLSKVKNYSLTNTELFSNVRNNEILVLHTWFDSRAWKPGEILATICVIGKIQNIVKSNGKTVFIFLLIPDKGTAYADYIVNPEFTLLENIEQQMRDNNVNVPKLQNHLKNAIDSGIKDIYLPNDTHFGSKGYQLTAKALHELLLELGVDLN